MADDDNAAALAGAMIRLRALARAEPGTMPYLPAGPGRRVGWRVWPDGTEAVEVGRELWADGCDDADEAGIRANLPPGMRVVMMRKGFGLGRYPHAVVVTLAPDA